MMRKYKLTWKGPDHDTAIGEGLNVIQALTGLGYPASGLHDLEMWEEIEPLPVQESEPVLVMKPLRSRVTARSARKSLVES